MKRSLLAIAALALAATVSAAEKFRTVPGVECDPDVGICSDERGPSVGLTRLYLGDEAADHLLATLTALDGAEKPASEEEATEVEPGPAVRYPKTGVACDDGVRACYVARGAHNGMTKAEYGADAVHELARRAKLAPDAPGAIVRPGRSEVCDTLSQACYRAGQADIALTEHHYGLEAAGRLELRVTP